MTNQKLELTWLGKGEQPRLEPRLLLLEPEHCHGDPNADNILIHGDNLLALKALEQQYAGKVKCIYIDPPYNTGSAFTHYDDMVEHSLWLTLMKHRLEILRRLLSPDGSIWISIDDNECHYLKVLCDEVFGRGNFVSDVIWEKKYSPQANSIWLSDSHDHILVFAKNKDLWRPSLLPRTEEMNDRYKNPDGDIKGIWKSVDFTISLTGGQRGAQYAKTGESKNIYEITTPSGRKVLPPKGRCWLVTPAKYEELLIENRIWFGESGNNVPSIKRYLTEVMDGIVAKTIWFRTEVGDNQEAKQEIRKINEDNIFSTPKPERLIQRILTLATNPGDLVLDSFLGSGTTAAVAHKMKRRWIGIELGEHCYTHCVPRLRKVVSGEDYGGISKAIDWKGGGGFKTYRLAPSLLAADEHAMLRFNPDFTDDMVAEAVAKIEGFTYAPDPEVFWKQSRSSEQDYLLVTKIFVTAEWLAQLHAQMAEGESLLLCCPAYGDGCERAFSNISIKKIPHAFMRKYEFGKDDYSLNVENVIGGSEDAERTAGAWEEDLPDTPPLKKGKRKDDQQPTLF